MQDGKYAKCGRKVRFKCQHCGKCCTEFFVPIGAEDLRVLQEKTGSIKGRIVTVDALNPITGKEVSTPSLVQPCPFHDKEHKLCSIYMYRPKTCVIFPFFVKKENGEMHYFYSTNCPGIGMGESVDLFELHKTCRELDDDINALKEKYGLK
jgi:Fe-S-cluster containining protein